MHLVLNIPNLGIIIEECLQEVLQEFDECILQWTSEGIMIGTYINRNFGQMIRKLSAGDYIIMSADSYCNNEILLDKKPNCDYGFAIQTRDIVKGNQVAP